MLVDRLLFTLSPFLPDILRPMPRQKDCREIHAYGYRFVPDTDLEGREGYAVIDSNPHSPWCEIATIFPADPRRPLHAENNAFLQTLDYGSRRFEPQGVYSFDEALRRAAQHADRSREEYGPADARFDEYIVAQTLADRDPDRPKEQTPQALEDRAQERDAAIEKLRARDGQQSEKARDDTLAAKAWKKIREAKQRREDEKKRGRDRDGGRERD